MSIIKSIDEEGRESTNIQPDSNTETTVADLKERGHTQIHNPETGEKYLSPDYAITYIKQMCITYLRSEDETLKAQIISIIKKEVETL